MIDRYVVTIKIISWYLVLFFLLIYIYNYGNTFYTKTYYDFRSSKLPPITKVVNSSHCQKLSWLIIIPIII